MKYEKKTGTIYIILNYYLNCICICEACMVFFQFNIFIHEDDQMILSTQKSTISVKS